MRRNNRRADGSLRPTSEGPAPRKEEPVELRNVSAEGLPKSFFE
jgi:hypothetical protein